MESLDKYLLAESTEYEFKSALEEDKPKSWLKTVSAFANGIGGSIYFGVDDDGKVVGIVDIKGVSDKISELIKMRIEPSVTVELKPLQIDRRNVVCLKIPGGTNTPYFYVGDGTKTAFYRLGNESVQAPQNILMELTLKGAHQTFDALNSNKALADYSFTQFEATYLEKTGSRLDRPRDYTSFGLLYDDKNLSFAGALLADQYIVYNSRIFCTRWIGKTKTSRFEAKDDAEYEGNIIFLYNEGLAFVRRNSALMWRKTLNGREEFHDYPLDAVKEALVNAIVHREYIIKGSEIHIDMYDDRLEIVSPGAMPNGRRIQEIDINDVASVRRNPVICDVFSRMRFMERRGSGLRKIVERYPADNKPVFRSTPQSFIVTLPNLNYGKASISAMVGGNGGNLGGNGGNSETIEQQGKIIAVLKDNPSFTAAKIAAAIGVSQRNIERQLKGLKDSGAIERVGGTRGYWVVK